MKRYIQNIWVNEVFHMRNFRISTESDETPHLIITGKNGCGKTALLDAIMESLKIGMEFAIKPNTGEPIDLYSRVKFDFTDLNPFVKIQRDEPFIIAYYGSGRKINGTSRNPFKPEFSKPWESKDIETLDFFNFLADLRVKQVFAKNEQLTEDVNKIEQWFVNFENLLKKVFQDKDLRLVFKCKDYSFSIETGGKTFGFMEISAGFSGILSIITDLLLKMHNKDNPVWNCEQEGIVLIDEVEVHLHPDLQKIILPLLTKIFPNIQFIVTTHSSAVLNSINTAATFDLGERL